MLTSTPPIIQLQVTSNGHEWKEEETFMSSQINGNGNLQQQQNGGGGNHSSSSFCHSPIFGISHIFARQKSEEADRKRRMTMPLVYRCVMYESQREDLCGTIRGPDDDFCRILCDDIDEEAGGHFADSVIALLTPAHIYTTKTLYYAISGKSFSRCVAVEIGLTGTTQQLKVICDTYQTEFRTSLERDLTMKIEGLFGKILLQLLVRKDEPNNKSSDNEGEEEEETAIREADKLFVEGGIEELGRGSSGGGGGGEGPFHKSRERSQERRGRDFETSIRKCVNIHSDVKQAILLYVRIAKNMQLYFAERLHEAISQNRPDHSSIIRILVSRSEIDLYDICNEYKRRYGHPLVYDLQQMCSGDFFRLLSQLVNPSELASGDAEGKEMTKNIRNTYTHFL
uniref:Annexin n=1 Tax=Meloidogyne javanica TaxID=6303 RepID=A0A915N412_MELJA